MVKDFDWRLLADLIDVVTNFYLSYQRRQKIVKNTK